MAATSLDRLGRSPLHYAAGSRASEDVVTLIASGEDCSLPDRAGWTPLHFAAQADDPATIQILIIAGAEIDACDEHGNTPLWRAVFSYRGDGRSIDALRAAGANENCANAHGVSPRSLAHRIANYNVAGLFP